MIQKGAGSMLSGVLKGIQVVSYYVLDWQKAKKFYIETLGLPVTGYIDDKVGWMELGEKDGTHLALSQWRGPEPVPPRMGGAIVTFAVEDAFEAVRQLRKRGVICEDAVGIPEMVTFANFYDPEGNLLQVAGPPPKG
jgi:predicted enzyme related to lactoylglutathione lyase